MPLREKQIEILQKMTSSPYPPEPPEKSLLVSAFVRLAKLMNKNGLSTPHLYKGTHMAKIQYEYDAAPMFFKSLKRYIQSDIFDNRDVLDAGCGWGGKSI